MAKVFKKGDTVYFSAIGSLVNRGTVEKIEGPYIKVKSKVPGTDYIMVSEAFPTAEELRKSDAYSAAWSAQNERLRMRESFGGILSMGIF